MSTARSWTDELADLRALVAFRLAGRAAMQEALAEAAPHLLEPVHKLVLVTPASSTSRVSSAVASRRGQMLGMGPREGWTVDEAEKWLSPNLGYRTEDE